MTRLACAALFFFSLFPAPLLWGLNRTPSAVHKVNACLRPNTPVDFGVLLHSKVIAVGLFHRVGVDVSWTCSADPESPPANTESIIVELSAGASDSIHPGALGYARPRAASGVRAVVFYGRIEPVIQSNPNAGAALLAYVLVHEIGHVLSGVAVHTPAGVMRAHWSPEDIHLIATHRLELSADDVRLILAAQPAVPRAAPDSFPVP